MISLTLSSKSQFSKSSFRSLTDETVLQLFSTKDNYFPIMQSTKDEMAPSLYF